MPDGDALQQARAQIKELLEAARKGIIIPVRLPTQIEAIEALLEQADSQQAEAAKATAVPANVDELLKSQAQFISHAIHELRTPVTSIRGYSDMLNTPAMGELNPMQKQFVDVIRTNTKRMEGLLTDVSYVTKLRAGTLRLNEKMDMFKNIAMMLQKKAEPIATELNRQLEIEEVPQGLPLLNTDGEMLSNALIKLIENGLRYSAEGDGKVTVSSTHEGNTLKIVIADNGIGMTSEELAQLGSLYFRSDNDLVRSYKGSGLGITIAYGIVELLGGKVTVESEVNKGTTFTVSLPGMS
jgi:signal transduction histidine kinase